MAVKLFPEFPPVPVEKWEEIITKDLKGGDYQKKLVWKTLEGFSVAPYYSAADLKDLKHLDSAPGAFPYVRGTKNDNDWYIHQGICIGDGDYSNANKQALELLNRGVESLGFYVDSKKTLSVEDYKTLLSDIDITVAPINFCGSSLENIENLRNFVQYLDSVNADKEQVKASFNFNPMLYLTQFGGYCKDAFEKLKECILIVKEYKGIKVISVNGYIFNQSGATSTQELAYSLAIGSEYVSNLTDLGLEVKEVAKRMKFSFSIGSSYFMEIAKFRAARLLWANVIETYGTNSNCAKKMDIHATTSGWNQTVYDAYVNMLRGTTEAMSAAIAGVDTLEVLPFDFAFRMPTTFSNRIARNVQSVLKEEAHFNKITDPSAGSYYIENLTNSIAEAAWTLFCSVEKAGGYIASFKEGSIQSEIKAIAASKAKNFATRRETLLGVNQYPNFLEKAEDCITKEIVSKDIPTLMGMPIGDCSCAENKIAEPLVPYRASQEFEALRLATDQSGKEPKAFMLTFGSLAMCRARAQFSSNFFAVAGIRVVDNNRFETVEEGVKAAIAANADIVVACSSDDDYVEAVPQIAKLLGDKAILVVAGAPACQEELEAKGITNFINVKSNVLETLKGYQAKLGIKAI